MPVIQLATIGFGIGRFAIHPNVIGNRRMKGTRSVCATGKIPPGIRPAMPANVPGRPGGMLSNASSGNSTRPAMRSGCRTAVSCGPPQSTATRITS